MQTADLFAACDRRRWLQMGLAGAAAVVSAGPLRLALGAEPPRRNGSSHFKLSLAAYSFNRVLPKAWTVEQLAEARFTLERFIDFCADQNLDGCELTAYYFPKSITTDYLLSLKERAFRLGLCISGTAIGNDFCTADEARRAQSIAMTREWIDHSAVLGAPCIRIFAGSVGKGDTEEAARARCVAAIDECVEYAAAKGVALALENHGGITSTAEQLLKIVEAVKPSPWFGVNFDGGNFRTKDPYADLAKIAPYAINAQLKVEMMPEGGAKEPADLARVLQILRDAGYRGFVALEYEAADDPFTAIPEHLRTLRRLISG
uniref:Sugar phosphate isomerase/epimerase n=1 Tax=Schlesneria paludicola TaxID=360056 RepID=A0A7C4QNB3_9PLAN